MNIAGIISGKFLLALIFLISYFSGSGAIAAVKVPKQLEQMGFAQELLVSYRREATIEFYEFYDWRTQDKEDTVVFIVKNGRIQEWYDFKGTVKDKNAILIKGEQK